MVDLKHLRILQNIETGIQPAGVAVSPDGHFLYVSNYNTLYASPDFQNLTPGEGTISIIRLKNRDPSHTAVIASTIPIGQSPTTMTLSHDGKKLYVCQYLQNTVTAISLNK